MDSWKRETKKPKAFLVEIRYIWHFINTLSTIGTRYMDMESRKQSLSFTWDTFKCLFCNSAPQLLLESSRIFIHLSIYDIYICLFSLQMCNTDRNDCQNIYFENEMEKKKKVRLRAVLKHSIRNVSVNLWTQNKPTPIRGTYIVIAIRRSSVSFLFLSSYFVTLVEGSNLHCCNFSLLHATDLFTKSAV